MPSNESSSGELAGVGSHAPHAPHAPTFRPSVDDWATRSDPKMWPSHVVRRQHLAIIIVIVAVFMVFVDLSIVFVALPTLERNGHATFSQAEWVIAGYELGYASVLMLGGRLGDMFGIRNIFVFGMAIFGVASAACGFAPDAAVLDAARVVQGIGAGLLYPQLLPVVRALPTEGARRVAIAMLGATIGLALVAGPLLGGGLIALDIGGPAHAWRPIFLVNVPFALFAIVGGEMSLPARSAAKRARMHGVSLFLVSASLFCLVLPLVEAPDSGWPRVSIELLIACLIFAAAFIVWERRDTARGVTPLIDPALIGDPAFGRGALLTFILFLGVPAFFFILTLFLQFGAGFSPLRTGLTVMPYALGTAIGAGLSMRFLDRIGKKGMYLGCVLQAGGIVAMARDVAQMGPHSSLNELLAAMFVCGIGVGSTVAPIVSVLLAGMKVDDPGSASGIVTAAQQVGAAMGVAVMGVLLFSFLGSHATEVLQHQIPGVERQLTATGVPAAILPTVVADYKICFDQAAADRDFSTLPHSCQILNGARPTDGLVYRVKVILTADGYQGRETVLGVVSERVLLIDAGVFVVAFMLLLTLPKPNMDLLAESTPI